VGSLITGVVVLGAPSTVVVVAPATVVADAGTVVPGSVVPGSVVALEVTRRLGPGAAVVVGATVVDEPSPAAVVVVDELSVVPGSLRQPCTGRRYT
jgi:hypothetical protein